MSTSPSARPLCSRPWLDRALIVAFLASIAAPTVDFFARPETRNQVRVEERTPARSPQIEPRQKSLNAFPEAYEAWFDDTFGLRDKLVRWHNIVEYDGFGISPNPQVFFGKQGWMYLNVGPQVAVYRGLQPFGPSELEAWRRSLESRRDFCAKYGARYVFILAPNKSEVYPEYMPDKFNRLGPTCLDQLLAYMHEHSTVEVFDLRPSQFAEKLSDRGLDFTYYPLGTHWTDRGLYAGYTAILEHVRAIFPGFERLVAVLRSNLTWEDDPGEGDSWAARLYMKDRLHQLGRLIADIGQSHARIVTPPGRDQYTMVTEHEDATLPHLVMFHDSFADRMRRLLAENFARSVFIWHSAFQPDVVAAEKPDLVLQLYVERSILVNQPVRVMSAGDVELSGEFEASRDVRLRIDVHADPPDVEPWGETKIARVEDGIEARTTTPLDMLRLPACEFATRGMPLVFIDISSPIDTRLVVLYQTTKEKTYRRWHSYTAALVTGRNRLFLELLDRDITGRLLIRPGTEGGTFVLHGVEVRAVER